MKKGLVLLSILFLPALIYVYFALGVPKVIRAPFFGPRTVAEVTDPKTGNKRIDTVYYAIPAFQCLTLGGLPFDSEKTLNGRSYVAIFLPKDSLKSMLPILAQDIKLNRASYGYARFVFFMQTDSAGAVPVDAPDMAVEMGLGTDTAFTVFMTPEAFDSFHDLHYFVQDPARKKDPWKTTTDAILIDRLARIRGYYNIRFAADIKNMKQDVNHILLRDEFAQTLEESSVEQKR